MTAGHGRGIARGPNAARQDLAGYEWFNTDLLVSRGKWRVYAHPSLDYMAAWVDTEQTRIAISSETWETLAYDETAIAQFFTDMTGGAAGMKFIVTDAGPYAVAARKQGRANAVVDDSDPVAAIVAAANSLVLQAASMNRQPTAGQQGIFAERYAALRAELKALYLRLDQATAALELAGTVLYDATR